MSKTSNVKRPAGLAAATGSAYIEYPVQDRNDDCYQRYTLFMRRGKTRSRVARCWKTSADDSYTVDGIKKDFGMIRGGILECAKIVASKLGVKLHMGADYYV